jgi:hypothetical protein
MKILIVILLAAGVACASTFLVVSSQKNAQLKAAQENWAKEKAQLEAAATNNTASPATKTAVMSAPSSAPAEESPEDILNDLLAVKLGSGDERNTGLRYVVFKLESLAQRGTAAVPAIRVFLARNVDVEYSVQNNANNPNDPNANASNNNGSSNQTDQNNGSRRLNRGGFGGGGRRGFRNLQNLRTDWVAPPSLRLGLVGVLKEIGGPDAEQALVDMLNSTGRGVEVAYLARVLEEMAPGKYADAAVAAAKALLLNPPAIDDPDRLDDMARSYLFGVLEMFHDTSFVPNAEQMLVGADGRLDQDAMDYLNDVLKDQSVSALYAAYQNQNLTNQFDKMNLGREILNYVGENPQANQLFTDTLNNTNLPPPAKAFTVAQLAGGGFGPFASESPTDPQVVSARIQLLNQLQSQYADDQMMSQAIAATIDALSSGKQVNMRQIFGGRPGGGGGDNGGGQNQNQ